VELESDVAVALLRRAITTAFPPAVFRGAVTLADGEQWAEAIDDDLYLRDNLYGRAWTDVPDEIIDRHADGLSLLTADAFATFLPSWLVRSLDRLDGENEVRELTIYQFCGGGGPPLPQNVQAHFDTCHLAKLKQLNAVQLTVLREFLSLVGMRERNPYIRESAQEALLNLETVP